MGNLAHLWICRSRSPVSRRMWVLLLLSFVVFEIKVPGAPRKEDMGEEKSEVGVTATIHDPSSTDVRLR